MSIFPGQGVKHGLGFGVIQRIQEKRVKLRDGQNGVEIYDNVPDLSKIEVKFPSGAILVCNSNQLERAEMPESELLFLRAKHGMIEIEEAGD